MYHPVQGIISVDPTAILRSLLKHVADCLPFQLADEVPGSYDGVCVLGVDGGIRIQVSFVTSVFVLCLLNLTLCRRRLNPNVNPAGVVVL